MNIVSVLMPHCETDILVTTSLVRKVNFILGNILPFAVQTKYQFGATQPNFIVIFSGTLSRCLHI